MLMLVFLLSLVKPGQAPSPKNAIEQVLTLYPELKATGPPTPKPAGPILVFGAACTTSTRCETTCCDNVYKMCLYPEKVLENEHSCLA